MRLNDPSLPFLVRTGRYMPAGLHTPRLTVVAVKVHILCFKAPFQAMVGEANMLPGIFSDCNACLCSGAFRPMCVTRKLLPW